jgi:beta-lactamase class A
MPNRSIPLYVSIVTFAVGLSIPITYFYLKGKEASNNNDSTLSASLSASDNCQHHSFRLKGYQYTRPLLFAEEECESKDLKDIKSQVSTKIEQLKSSGIISSASFYLRIFQNGEWTGCNVDEKFNPSSLMKVPVMMTILKMADKSPEFLEKKIKFIPDGTYIPNQSFHDKEIEPNREYSVKELLSYMILYSDNNATHLLNQKMDLSVFKKMFTDIGIQEPNVIDKFYQISSRDY